MRRLVVALGAVGLLLLLAVLASRCDAGRAAPPAQGAGPTGAPSTLPAVGGMPADVAAATAASGRDSDDAGRTAMTAGVEFAAARTGYVGRVVARGGEPVPGISVRLFRLAPDVILVDGLDPFLRTPVSPQLEAARATTGGDGRFELGGVLPRGLCFLRLEFPDLDRVPPAWRTGQATVAPVQRTPAPGEVVDLGDLLLKAGAVLAGRVVGDDGRPVAGALVRAANLPALPWSLVPIERLRADGAVFVTAAARQAVVELPPWIGGLLAVLPVPATATGADGTFTLWGVDAGDAVVAVTAPGRASLVRQGIAVAAASTTSLGDLRLPDGVATEVAVTTTDGRPVAGAEVLLAPLSGIPVHIAERGGRTDVDGSVTVRGLPRGAALAAARRTAADPWRLGEPGPADGRLRVVLPASFALTLTVLDAGQRPARDVRLQVVDGGVAARVVEMAMFGLGRGLDLQGRLQRLDDGRIRVGDLPAGTWCVAVAAAGCAATRVEVELLADVERTVQLSAARPLVVRVLDAAGAPVPQATVYVEPRGAGRTRRVADVPLPGGRTGADGRCTVADLPTDEARVTAAHPLHGQVHATVAGAPPELVLQFAAAGAIDGTLTDGGRAPQAGRWLVVLERRHEKSPRGAVPDLPQLALPDLEGRFTFGALQPGTYRLTAQDSATDVGTIGELVRYQARRTQIYPWNKAEVDLHGGERAQVRLDAMVDAAPFDGPGAFVRGVVTIDSSPGAGALVVGTSKQPERRITSRVDQGGAFDLGRVPAGALRVVVVPREVAESRLLEHLFSHHFARDVDVRDGEPQQLLIELATGAVEGQVMDWNGAAVAACRVVLFDRGAGTRSSALRVARTDAAGAFRFLQLPAGVYELRAHKEGHGTRTVRELGVTAGTSVGPLAILLQETARVAGRVEVAALPKPGPIGLVLHPLSGGDAARGGADREGAFQLADVPVGRYRVEIGVWGDPTPYAAGELEVHAPATTGVVLLPRAR